MPKESFLYPETKPVFDLVEEAGRRSGVSRGQAFEDFLHLSVCALSGGQMEAQYLATVKRYAEGRRGKRGCDFLAQAFGTLVEAMEQTRRDILGDLFQGGITYGEAGQFLTPESVCQLMAKMTVDGAETGLGKRTVCDPCCGSGRMLLAVADIQPHWEFIGQDVDLRCVRMTAINLALRNLYGHVIWGNSLGHQERLVYRTGFDLRGLVHEAQLADCGHTVQEIADSTLPAPVEPREPILPSDSSGPSSPPSRSPKRQLRLF